MSILVASLKFYDETLAINELQSLIVYVSKRLWLDSRNWRDINHVRVIIIIIIITHIKRCKERSAIPVDKCCLLILLLFRFFFWKWHRSLWLAWLSKLTNRSIKGRRKRRHQTALLCFVSFCLSLFLCSFFLYMLYVLCVSMDLSVWNK